MSRCSTFRTRTHRTSLNQFPTMSSQVCAMSLPVGLKMASTFLGNSTSIQEMFKSQRAVHCHVQAESFPALVHR